jgi:hypothetical protein
LRDFCPRAGTSSGSAPMIRKGLPSTRTMAVREWGRPVQCAVRLSVSLSLADQMLK